MLVCPQCQSENSNQKEVCQQCGTSLIDKPCPQCHATVSINQTTCSECGAFVGTIWHAIVAKPLGFQAEQSLTAGCQYLDVGQRYQLWQPEIDPPFQLIATTAACQVYQAKVVDGQPLQKSALQVLLQQSADLMSEAEREEPTTLWKQIGIPSVAFPYFTLQDLSPTLPHLHDGWCDGETEVILLSDRSDWQLMSELVTTQSLPTIQIIYWLNQMVVLWQSLSSINCCQSLLVAENLRIDEDQSFGLQQLYPNPSETPLPVKALGQLWQTWFQEGDYPISTPLADLIQAVADGQLDQISELRLHLQDLAVDAQITEEKEMAESEESNSWDSNDLPEFQDEFMSDGLGEIPTATDMAHEPLTAVFPMVLSDLNQLGCTDRGQQRHHNEDYFGLKTQISCQQNNQETTLHGRGLYIVCDGMGGHAAGEVASQMAVETLENYFEEHWQDQFPDYDTILQGILLTNQKLYDVNQKNASSGSGRMGTTLVLMLVENTQVAIAHVGDSRIYCLTRKGGIQQLTVDHEVGQRAIQSGIDPKLAYARPDAYQLTQALGPNESQYVQPDIQFLEVKEDRLFLLCSDGLCDNDLVDDHWETYLSPLLNATQPLETGMSKLIGFANQYNGHDNITAVLVRLNVRPKVSFSD